MNWGFVAIAAGCFIFVYLVIASWVGRKLKQRRLIDSHPELDPDVNLGELNPLKQGKCPDCGGKDFLMGPRGGMCQNIQCDGCGSKFNVGLSGISLFHAERI